MNKLLQKNSRKDLFIRDKELYLKVQLVKEQEDKIIKELERKLKVFSNKNSNTCKPDFVEYIVTKLAPYYKDKNNIQEFEDMVKKLEKNKRRINVKSKK